MALRPCYSCCFTLGQKSDMAKTQGNIFSERVKHC